MCPQSSVSSTPRASMRSWISCDCSSSSPASWTMSESSERFTQPLVSPCATSASRRAWRSGSIAILLRGWPDRGTAKRRWRAPCRQLDRPRLAGGREGVGLEVLGDDVAGLEGGDETLDLVLHVGLHQVLQVAHERLGAAVELLVEALDDVLLEDAGAGPLAVRAAQHDFPVRVAGLFPIDGVDELALARAAHVQVLGRLGRRAGRVGDVAEVDDLDGLAGGQDDAADVGVVFGLAAHVMAPGRNLIGRPAPGLYVWTHHVRNWRVGAHGDPFGDVPQYICAYAEHRTPRAGDPPADRAHHLRPEAASRLGPAARLGHARVQGLDHRQGQGQRRGAGRVRHAGAAPDALRARSVRGGARGRHRRGPPRGPARLAHRFLRAQRDAMGVVRPVGHEERLSLIEHLDELRTRLIYCIAAFVVCFSICYWQNHWLLETVNKPLQSTQNLDGKKRSQDPLEEAARFQIRTGAAQKQAVAAFRSARRFYAALAADSGLSLRPRTLARGAAA